MTTPANIPSSEAPHAGFWERIPINRSVMIAIGVAVIAYAIAIVGALMLRNASGIDGVNRFVESLSGSAGTGIRGLGLKLGFAYAAGAVSAVNPCGFAMLPAYLGLYVSGRDQEHNNRFQFSTVAGSLKAGLLVTQSVSFALLIARAIMIGLSVSVGFVLLFGVAGFILGFGSKAIVISALPYVGLAVGVLLVGAGAFMAAGGKIYTSLAQRAASRVGNPDQLNVGGYVLFGVSYGLASLSCTLPVFLAVLGVGAGLSSGWVDTISQFVLYAVGMGSVILALTLGMAVARTVLVRWLRKVLPYVGIVGAWLMVVAGTYIVFYWLTLGDLL